MAAQIVKLQAANEAASERKGRKRKRIQLEGTLSQQDAEAIIEQKDARALVEAERREKRVQTGSSGQGVRHCRRCGETGHNMRTCKKDTVEIAD
jgi:hypothetical protein